MVVLKGVLDVLEDCENLPWEARGGSGVVAGRKDKRGNLDICVLGTWGPPCKMKPHICVSREVLAPAFPAPRDPAVCIPSVLTSPCRSSG